MSPIQAISPNLSSMMPNLDAVMPGAGNGAGTDSTLPNVGNILPDASPLPSINGIEMPSDLAMPVGGTQPSTNSFANMLGQFVSEVNAKSAASGQAVSALQSGQNIPLHQAVIAMEESNVSFQLMVEVRNKLLDSYQEIMHMQV